MKKCTSKLTNSPAVWSLAVAGQLRPGVDASGGASSHAKAGEAGGKEMPCILWICLVIDSGNRPVSLSW